MKILGLKKFIILIKRKRIWEYASCISAIFAREITCGFMVAIVGDKTLPKMGFYSLTLLHSERPKLHTILAFLSAIGFRKEFASKAVFIFF